jgi:hypothetical protein
VGGPKALRATGILESLGFRRVSERAHDFPRWPKGVPLVRYELDSDVAP